MAEARYFPIFDESGNLVESFDTQEEAFAYLIKWACAEELDENGAAIIPCDAQGQPCADAIHPSDVPLD